MVYTYDAVVAGEFGTKIIISAVTEAGEALDDFEIPVKGQVVCPFRISPNDIAVGPQPIGSWVEKRVSVASIKGVSFHAELLNPDGDGVKIEWLDRNDSAAPQQMNVSLKVSKVGDQSWEIPLRVRPLVENSRHVDLKFAVRAYGVADSHTLAASERSR